MERFRSQYMEKFPHDAPEVNSGELITETAGYVPAQIRIEDMIMAGQRLELGRAAQFDFNGVKPEEDFYDPTRNRGFDMADAFQIQEQIKKKKLDHEAYVKASYKAQEALKGTSELVNDVVDPEDKKVFKRAIQAE
ncbi:MAG: hypothetical protein [Microvirus sp.]|nr:MAG: hypothetical protein [Microvirus sp.]